jgi:hypothetical protein
VTGSVTAPIGADEREVANAPEQPVRDARRSPRAARDLERGIVVHGSCRGCRPSAGTMRSRSGVP